jgi:diaminopimelate decarboxylase
VTHLRRSCAFAHWRRLPAADRRRVSRDGEGQNRLVLDLFPDTAAVDEGRLTIGGCRLPALADEFGTPLVVYCEETLRARAQAYRAAAPDALVVYGTKAFPNVALLRLFAEEGLGADVSTLGELAFARRAGVPGDRLVVHGNNKSDAELRAAADARAAFIVLDSLEEIPRAAAAGVRRTLVRITPGIEAETHEAIRTGHVGSKFGLPAEDAIEAVAEARVAGLEVAGVHVHVGSDLRDLTAAEATVDWLGAFAVACRAELDWTPSVVDLGGGLATRSVPEDVVPSIADFAGGLVERFEAAWRLHDLPRARVVLEPGRSLVAEAGVTLYRVGIVKRASETVTYVAIDGGMSDNPRPQLYGARQTALLANRPEEPTAGRYAVCGKHCEAGDVLIADVSLPEPRREDVLAVPGSGAYTLGMASNYNGVPRPAAVLVADGEATLIRRRETVEDLLAYEAS